MTTPQDTPPSADELTRKIQADLHALFARAARSAPAPAQPQSEAPQTPPPDADKTDGQP